MKEKLLFVTKGGESSDEGFSYVLELAKTLNSGIAVLFVYNKGAMDTYEDVMAAVAFAEAGDLDTVREFMTKEEIEIKESERRRIEEMTAKCRGSSIDFIYQTSAGDPISAIKNFLKKRPEIEMVLLSPDLSGTKKEINLKKLLKNITRPVVTIARPARASI